MISFLRRHFCIQLTVNVTKDFRGESKAYFMGPSVTFYPVITDCQLGDGLRLSLKMFHVPTSCVNCRVDTNLYLVLPKGFSSIFLGNIG